MTDVRISRIKNGFTVYDDGSTEEVYYKTLDAALKRVEEIFNVIMGKVEMKSAET